MVVMGLTKQVGRLFYSMTGAIKISQILRILTFFVLLGFSGCADMKLPTWMTGEPDENELSMSQDLGTPTIVGDETWPSLRDIPNRPKFQNSEETQDIIDELERDKAEAGAIRERLDNNLKGE